MFDIDNIKNAVRASMMVENQKPSQNGENITEMFLNKKITSEEAINKIKQYYNVCKVQTEKKR